MGKTTIQPYLFFGGRCEEAINFYSKTLGARVEMIMRYKESPEPPPPGMLQAGFEDKIMHATIQIGETVVMVSDGCDDKSGFEGFRLSLALPTEADARRAFNGLSDGGEIQMPLAKTFWSECFGMVIDRFGLGWMITVIAEES